MSAGRQRRAPRQGGAIGPRGEGERDGPERGRRVADRHDAPGLQPRRRDGRHQHDARALLAHEHVAQQRHVLGGPPGVGNGAEVDRAVRQRKQAGLERRAGRRGVGEL